MRLRLAILAALLAAQADAATLYVSTTGSHDTNAPAFSTWASAATNIQAAIDAASAGDTLILAQGEYTGGAVFNLKRDIAMRSVYGTLWDADKTIVRNTGNTYNLHLYNSTNITISGLSFLGSDFAIAVGQPGKISPAAGILIDSCVVRESTQSILGNVYVQAASSVILRNSIVAGNNGRGVERVNGTLIVESCIVEANGTHQLYGSIYVHNTIHGNASGITSTGGNVTNNTTNSVCRMLDIAPASEGVGTNLVWAGVAAYIPRIGSLAQGAGVGYAGIDAAKSGDGGPTLIQRNREGYVVVTNNGKFIYGIPLAEATYIVPTSVTNLEILVVAGGGGGASGWGSIRGGGGGAGGVIWTNMEVFAGDFFQYAIGTGGVAAAVVSGAAGGRGDNSGFGPIVAAGGGPARGPSVNGLAGGSGGGGTGNLAKEGGAATQTNSAFEYGNAGGRSTAVWAAPYWGGGGGGAGGAGADGSSATPGVGGAGLNVSASFSTNYGVAGVFARGGSSAGSAPTTNTGGGGAGGNNNAIGTAGASGAILVRALGDGIDVVTNLLEVSYSYAYSGSDTNTISVGDRFLYSPLGLIIECHAIDNAISTGPFNIRNPIIHPSYHEAF